MFALLFILFATTTMFSIQGMEPIVEHKKPSKTSLLRKRHSYTEQSVTIDNKPSQKQLRKSYSNTTGSPKVPNTNQTNLQTQRPLVLANESLNKTNNTNQINLQEEHPFVLAVHNNNVVLVQEYLSKPYFNPNQHRHITAVDTCIQNKNCVLLLLLFKDPRINVCTKNKSGFSSLDFIRQEKLQQQDNPEQTELLSQLQRNYFNRMVLDRETNNACRQLKSFYEKGFLADDLTQATAERIKTKITRIEEEQFISGKEQQEVEDRKMPEEACFPEYANLTFMMNKIEFNVLSQEYQ